MDLSFSRCEIEERNIEVASQPGCDNISMCTNDVLSYIYGKLSCDRKTIQV